MFWSLRKLERVTGQNRFWTPELTDPLEQTTNAEAMAIL